MTAGPESGRVGWAESAEVDAVWLTGESLGDADRALVAHPDVPAVFCFDEPLLSGLMLSGKRLVFLVETLADLATRRPVEIRRGRVADELAGRRLAVTFAPGAGVPPPGRRARARGGAPVALALPPARRSHPVLLGVAQGDARAARPLSAPRASGRPAILPGRGR